MASEKDSGRDIKLTISIVAGLVVIVVGGAYLIYGWLVTPPPVESRIDLSRVATTNARQATESPEYQRLLNQSNTTGAMEAKKKNVSFVASIPFQQEPVEPPPKATPKPTASATTSGKQQGANQKPQETPEQIEARKKKVADLVTKFQGANGLSKVGDLGVGVVPDGSGNGDGSGFQAWSESLPGGYRPKAVAGASPVGAAMSALPPIEIIPAYWSGPGTIEIGIDSDNNITPVIGRISTGPYDGATLEAPESRLQGEGVVIHFTSMNYKGVTYKVNAYALNEETLTASVASEVNHRYMSRIVLPAVLNGLGGISQLYAQANSQVVSNGFTTETVRPGMPDGAAVLGVIAGGTATQAAKALATDAAKVPPVQVKVRHREVVKIQFFGAVYNTDAIAPGRGGELVRPAVPASQVTSRAPDPVQPALPATPADDWRRQTESRIQEQRALLGQ